jgi:cupin fold WbuC family metalloprotein
MAGGRVQPIDAGLFERVLDGARASSRRRLNFNFHATPGENPSRFLNVLLRGTYITPHRHIDPPKAESLIVLEGRVAFLVFDDDGRIEERYSLDSGRGIDVGSGVWHTAAALSEHAVCFEVKPGPYAAASDKDFAPWAPREGDPRSVAYLESLLCEFKQSS